MAEVEIQVLFNRLPAIAEALQAHANAAAMKTGEDVAGMARALAPVHTGRLRDSITVGSESDGATVYTDTPYAPYLEMGTYKMAARPFMTPAAEGERSNFTDRLAESLIELQ